MRYFSSTILGCSPASSVSLIVTLIGSRPPLSPSETACAAFTFSLVFRTRSCRFYPLPGVRQALVQVDAHARCWQIVRRHGGDGSYDQREYGVQAGKVETRGSGSESRAAYLISDLFEINVMFRDPAHCRPVIGELPVRVTD
jgi:hypothetical protein